MMGFRLNGFESSTIRMEPDGSVTVATGGAMMGQGLETTLAQIAADALGTSLDRVRVISGDSDRTPYSAAASIASRSMVVAGGALVQSSAQLASRIRAIAAHRLEASEDDIELVDGAAQVVGSPSSGIQHSDLARTAWLGWDLPEGCVPGLEEQSTYDPPDITYSYVYVCRRCCGRPGNRIGGGRGSLGR